MKITGIYKITNKLNGMNYIGQSVDINRRLREHFNPTIIEKRKHLKLYAAIKKYGESNFSKEILIECDKEQLNELEIILIKKHNSNNRYKGYNISSGGNDRTNYYWTKEMKEAKSIFMKERMSDPKERDKSRKTTSEWNKKMWNNPEYRKKRIEQLKNPKQSTRDKLSEIATKNNLLRWNNKEYFEKHTKTFYVFNQESNLVYKCNGANNVIKWMNEYYNNYKIKISQNNSLVLSAVNKNKKVYGFYISYSNELSLSGKAFYIYKVKNKYYLKKKDALSNSNKLEKIKVL